MKELLGFAQNFFDALLFQLDMLQRFKEKAFAKKLRQGTIRIVAEVVSVQESSAGTCKIYIRLKPDENTVLEGHLFAPADDNRMLCRGEEMILDLTAYFPESGLFVCYPNYFLVN